jgi:hypothetical protein
MADMIKQVIFNGAEVRKAKSLAKAALKHCDARIKKASKRNARAEALLMEALIIIKPNNKRLEKKIQRFIDEKTDAYL